VSKPLGFVAIETVKYFDDFDMMMPFMMNPTKQNKFDKERVTHVSEIRYLQLGTAIIGINVTYKVHETRYTPVAEAHKRPAKVYDSDNEDESEDEEIELSHSPYQVVKNEVRTRWVSKESLSDDNEEDRVGFLTHADLIQRDQARA
jgi:hypothetical protein